MKKVSCFLVILFLQLSFIPDALATDYDCADFGTQERAQHEFDQHRYLINEKGWRIEDNLDKYGLDRDSDGVACDWNPSSKRGMAWLSGLGILVGVFLAKSEQDRTFLLKNFFSQEAWYSALVCWWVPYLVMAISRSRLFSADTTPTTLYFLTFIFSVTGSFSLAIVGMRRNWI